MDGRLLGEMLEESNEVEDLGDGRDHGWMVREGETRVLEVNGRRFLVTVQEVQ